MNGKLTTHHLWIRTLVLLMASLAHASSGFRAENRCRGGSEGPKPFADVSAKLLAGAELIPTPSGLAEMAYAEGRDAIFYRDDYGRLEEIHLPGKEAKALSSVSEPLSRVLDENARFLVTEGDSWVFDLRTEKWIHYEPEARPFTYLYWHRDRLYSVSAQPEKGEQTEFRIARYLPGEPAAEPVCGYSARGALKLARGQSYPYLYLYGTRSSEAGPRLSVYQVDARHCELLSRLDFEEPMAGPVEDVFRFEELDAIAVRIAHPTKNLLWENLSTGCRYFDLHGLTPYIDNFKQPIVATWSRQEGLTLFNLATEKKGTLLKGFPFAELGTRDLWLSGAGDRLLVAPRVEGEATRSLLELQLSRF